MHGGCKLRRVDTVETFVTFSMHFKVMPFEKRYMVLTVVLFASCLMQKLFFIKLAL